MFCIENAIDYKPLRKTNVTNNASEAPKLIRFVCVYYNFKSKHLPCERVQLQEFDTPKILTINVLLLSYFVGCVEVVCYEFNVLNGKLFS